MARKLTPLQKDAKAAIRYFTKLMQSGRPFTVIPPPGVQRWLDALRQWMTANNDPRLTEGHLSEVLTASADFCEYLSGIANETVH